jgi:hypothetical protein
MSPPRALAARRAADREAFVGNDPATGWFSLFPTVSRFPRGLCADPAYPEPVTARLVLAAPLKPVTSMTDDERREFARTILAALRADQDASADES